MTARPRKRNVIFPKHQTAKALLDPVGICLPLLFRVSSWTMYEFAVCSKLPWTPTDIAGTETRPGNSDKLINNKGVLYSNLREKNPQLCMHSGSTCISGARSSSSTEKFLSNRQGEVMRWVHGVRTPMSFLCFNYRIHRMQLQCIVSLQAVWCKADPCL